MDYQKWEIAYNRFGMGAQLGHVVPKQVSPREWLISQLAPLKFTSKVGNSNDILQLLKNFRQANLLEKKSLSATSKNVEVMSKNMMATVTPTDKSIFQTKVKKSKESDSTTIRKKLIELSDTLMYDTLTQAVIADFSFQFRLLDFFSNHFSVSVNGINLRALGPTLEREAIAPHIGGQFEDMLMAVEQHPAMLFYLDNQSSTGPDSKLAKRQKKRGLNENLAREILELHTLGVDAAYTQNDVKELAMSITGWSVANGHNDKNTGFVFKKDAHQPGTRTILTKQYPNTESDEQGQRILKDLARHPATAKYLSFKLARHFINDQPDPKLLEAMTKAWLKTNGNLKAVLSALIEHPSAWKNEQAKYKTPREYVISCNRACGVKKINTPRQVNSFLLLGQKPFSAGSPAGYGDTNEDWNGAEALLARLEWAARFSAQFKVKSQLSVLQIAQSLLGGQLSDSTGRMLKFAKSRERAFVLLFMSPEFLRR